MAVDRVERAVEALSDGLLVRDAEGRLVLVNAAARRMLGVDTGAAVGDLDLSSADIAVSYEEAEAQAGDPTAPPAVDRLLGTADASPDTVVCLERTGESGRWLSVSTRPLLGGDGQPDGWVTRMTDISERYAFARAALRSIPERFDAVWRNAPVGMLLISVEAGSTGEIVSANLEAQHLLGRGNDDLVGRPHRSLVLPDERTASGMFADLAAGRERASRREHRFVRGDGSTVWVLEAAVGVPDAHGRPLFAAALLLDTSAQHDALENRERSDERLRTLMENSDELILSYEDEGEVTWVSPNIERVLGRDRDEVIGSDILEQFHPDDRAFASASAERLRRDPTSAARGRLRVRRGDGSWATLEGTSLVVGQEDPADKGLVMIGRDITDRLRAEAAARQSRAELENQVSAFGDLHFLLDATGRYVDFVGKEAFVPREDFIGRRSSDVLPAPVGEQLDELVVRTWHTGEAGRLEYELPFDDGPRHYEARTARVLDDRVACNVRDVTERKRSAAQIIERERRLARVEAQRAKERLEAQLQHAQRLESLGRLAGGVAHDFNNLLGVIVNYSEFVAEAVAGDEQASGDVAQIKSAAERGAALVRNLILFGRNESVTPEVFDLNDAVTDISDTLGRSVGPSHHLVVDGSDRLLPVNADRAQFEQVIVNLVLNACHATPDGGEIELRLRAVLMAGGDETRLELPRGEYAAVTVRDHGVGMPAEVVEQAFDPFFTTKTWGEGSGLGLASAHGIVDAAGGRITIDSAVGEGTTVAVYLPIAAVPGIDGPGSHASPSPGVAAQTAADTPDTAAATRERILVVDDEAGIVESTRRILRSAGYDVETAPDAITALSAIRSAPRPPDLVLSDVRMPTMTGGELALRIRATEPDVRVVLMSGFAEDLRALEGDDIRLLPKPVTPAVLLPVLEEELAARTVP